MDDRLREILEGARGAWDQLKDWWEWDGHFRQMIVLSAIVGAIGLIFACGEALAVRTIKG